MQGALRPALILVLLAGCRRSLPPHEALKEANDAVHAFQAWSQTLDSGVRIGNLGFDAIEAAQSEALTACTSKLSEMRSSRSSPRFAENSDELAKRAELQRAVDALYAFMNQH